jgi:hypothetical protein
VKAGLGEVLGEPVLIAEAAQLLRAERIAAEHGLPHVRHDARTALHSVR